MSDILPIPSPDARILPPPPGAALPAPPLAPPVAAQRTPGLEAMRLQSEKTIVAAPLSFAGSAQRIWRLTGMHEQPAVRVVLAVVAISLIACAWTVVLAWYFFFGLLLVPYRLIRRGQRKDKRQALQHREMMAAVQQQNQR